MLKKVNVVLEPELINWLDGLATTRTISRSSLLREIILDSKNWIKPFYINNEIKNGRSK